MVNVRPYFSKKTSITTDVIIFLLSNTFNVHTYTIIVVYKNTKH